MSSAIVSIRELLSLPEDTSPRDVLQAAIEAIKAGKAADNQAEDAVAASLGLKPGAGTTQIVAAITRLTQSTVPKDEWVRLKKELIGRESQALVNRYVMQGKLTASMQKHQLDKLRSGIDGFEDRKKEFLALMDAMPVIIPQGATQPPTGDGPSDRLAVINRASREFEAEPQLKKLTTRAAFIDLKLREDGLALLTQDERAKRA